MCKQYTAPRTLCTRNIFSRVAQNRATGSRLSHRLKVTQIMCLLKELFDALADHVSFALVIAGSSTFLSPVTPDLSISAISRPLVPRTKGLFSRFGHTKYAHNFLYFDISRAHFMPQDERELFVELPMKDPLLPPPPPLHGGQRLCTTLGEVHVSNSRRESRSHGAGVSKPVASYCEKTDVRWWCVRMTSCCSGIQTKYAVKFAAQVGEGEQEQHAVVLRCVRGMQMGGWQWNWTQLRGMWRFS